MVSQVLSGARFIAVNAWNTHWVELRTRVIRAVSVIFLVFLCFFYGDNALYSKLAQPFIQQLPKGASLVATEVTTPFTVPMKLAWVVALLVTAPYLLFQLWSFVAPGLHKNERRVVFPIILMSTLLFYSGLGFSYYVVCPLSLQFFTWSAPEGVLILTDIRHYLDFVLTVLFAGGVAFQVPVVTIACCKAGFVTVAQLSYIRPYVIVSAFVLGMLLTPPDVVSQVLLAIPMWTLFEGGLLYLKVSSARHGIWGRDVLD